MDADYLQQKHKAGLSYQQYMATGNEQQQQNWQTVYDQADLAKADQQLLEACVRRMNIIVLSGIWCGDCVQQGPLLQRIAQANPDKIDLRWLDRDEHMDLQEKVAINAGHRVPVALFCAEDYELVAWYGDRTLSRYRILADQQLGVSCPLPGAPVPTDQLNAALHDWVEQFERAHLILRLSARLRKKHND